jgi:ATP-dependent DNA ligase
MSILSILHKLGSEPGRNGKIAILKQHDDNQTLKEVCRLALDPQVNFYVKAIPQYTTSTNSKFVELGHALQSLRPLMERTVTGNAARAHLATILSSVSGDDAEVIERVISHDLECGVAVATCNAVWGKDFIKEFPVMKASAFGAKVMENMKYPALAQLKLDGARAVASNKAIFSGNGKAFDFCGVLETELARLVPDGWYVDGELLVVGNDGKAVPRKVGNGILNKALKGTITEADAKKVRFVVFDMIPIADYHKGVHRAPYQSRWMALRKLIKNQMENDLKIYNFIELAPSVEVNSEEEATEVFNTWYKMGQEGIILKDMAGPWENKRAGYQVKFKGIESCDLICVATEEGTGKNTGKIGALVCETSDGKLRVKVGTGLTDADREKDPSFYIDKIIEVQYNEVIATKTDRGTFSLFLPRFVTVRFDKDKANLFEEVKQNGKG